MKNDFELSASSCHNIGEYVIYRNNGICKISDIISENFNIDGDLARHNPEELGYTVMKYIAVNSIKKGGNI